jgi:hypothetical protein
MARTTPRPLFVLLAAAVLGVLYLGLPTHAPARARAAFGALRTPAASHPPQLVHPAPTRRVHDNLRNDTQYITTFTGSGFTKYACSPFLKRDVG